MMTKNLFTKCFVMMALAVLFVGCPKPTDSPEVVDDNVTLTFLYNDAGSEDYELTMKVKKGVKKALPLISDEFFSSWQAPGGKMFGGWVVSKGDIVTDEERIADPTIFDVGKLDSYTKNTTFVARWGTPVTVTFDKKNGSVDFGSQQMVKEFPMPLKDIYKTATEIGAPTGKEFAGWANQNGKQVIARNAQLFKPDADCTLDAIWMGDSFNNVLEDWTIGSNIGWQGSGETSDNSKERKPVSVKFDNAYALQDHEVTIKEWMNIIKQPITDMNNGFYSDEKYPENDRNINEYEPMRWVSWYDAIIYCNRLSVEKGFEPAYDTGDFDWQNYKFINVSPKFDVTCDFTKSGYRLPTEAEWECALRGDASKNITDRLLSVVNVEDHDKDDKWNDVTELQARGNIGRGDAKYNERFYSVMSLLPNGKGENLYYDMLGNVREWCWDSWVLGYADGNSRTSNQGACDPTYTEYGDSKVIRGGAYSSGISSGSNWRRLNYRDELHPSTRQIETGFRVCRTVTP